MPEHRYVDEAGFAGHTLSSPSGVTARVLANGTLETLSVGPIMVNLLVGSPVGGGATKLYGRTHDEKTLNGFSDLLERAAVSIEQQAIIWRGVFAGADYVVTLRLHPVETAWCWTVDWSGDATFDVVLVQDVGIAARGQSQNNEAYTSQYIDHRVLSHPDHGPVLAARQKPGPARRTPVGDARVCRRRGRHSQRWIAVLRGVTPNDGHTRNARSNRLARRGAAARMVDARAVFQGAAVGCADPIRGAVSLRIIRRRRRTRTSRRSSPTALAERARNPLRVPKMHQRAGRPFYGWKRSDSVINRRRPDERRPRGVVSRAAPPRRNPRRAHRQLFPRHRSPCGHPRQRIAHDPPPRPPAAHRRHARAVGRRRGRAACAAPSGPTAFSPATSAWGTPASTSCCRWPATPTAS